MKIQEQNQTDWNPKTKWTDYIALAVAILFFSGIFMKVQGHAWLGAFDFTTLGGKFGIISGEGSKLNFLGVKGEGARQGFIFALSLIPSIMLALGILEVLTEYGAIRAAHKLLTPLLYPIMRVPGRTGLALITDLQSTDAGAALTKELFDNKQVTLKELIIIAQWQYSGAGMISNYFSNGAALFGVLVLPLSIPLVCIFILKFLGAVLCRIALNTIYKGDFTNEQQ
ncbi:nucleoside recognition domain-containing protein [Veillonella intestinalis]|uniref:nucleoside recognition domain-containing protein n=1 Tax=Veillonella intestinalis TaxID=2941341 RepID=UPI002040B1C2|nr:nucleoside recognition domain-containing protein [Veillonella intestinalis]